jgi:hypothetical protein
MQCTCKDPLTKIEYVAGVEHCLVPHMQPGGQVDFVRRRDSPEVIEFIKGLNIAMRNGGPLCVKRGIARGLLANKECFVCLDRFGTKSDSSRFMSETCAHKACVRCYAEYCDRSGKEPGHCFVCMIA